MNYKLLNFCLCFIATVLLPSCSEEISDMTNNEATNLSMIYSRAGDCENPGIAYFDSVCSPELWRQHKSLEEMLNALNLPDYILNKLTTDQLAECCINYPLNINYLAYNDPDLGIKNVIDGFNGYKELKERIDYAQSLVTAYGNLSMLTRTTDVLKEKSEQVLNSRFNKKFLANILASGYYPQVFEATESQKLRTFLTYDLINDKTYSEFVTSTSTTDRLLQKLDGNDFSKTKSNSNLLYIYTLYNKSIEVFDPIELNSTEIAYNNNKYTSMYPEAEFLGSSTASYNCHYYAWGMRDNPTPHWMNFKNSQGNDNVSKYWSTDEYKQTSSTSNYTNVYYSKGDHSARKSSINGKVESKWGACPLMRHDIGYCPYNSKSLEYYIESTYVGPLYTSYGYGETTVGSNDDYYIPTGSIPASGLTFSWEVVTAKGDDAIELGYACLSITGYAQAKIKFTKPGLYEVSLSGYNTKGKCSVCYGFEPIVRE